MAATALVRLGRLCSRGDFEELAEGTLRLLGPIASDYPSAAGQALIALDFLLGPTREIAIVPGEAPGEVDDVLRAIHQRFVPNKVIACKPAGVADDALPAPLEPLLKGKTARAGRTTIYICEHGTCGLPVVGVEGIERALS
jgi:hypothetical protein